MEPQFVNQYHLSYEMYQYWSSHPVGEKAIKNRKKGIILRVALICCGAIVLLCGIILREFSFSVMGIAFLFFGIARLTFLPTQIIKKQYELMLKLQNRDKYIRTITFADVITSEDGNTTTTFEYNQITKTSEDASYFYLFLGNDTVLRIHKASFIVGNVDAFRAFCQSFSTVQYV